MDNHRVRANMFSYPKHHNTSHWHILGAGAIGCLWASQLVRKGVPTTLLVRPERLASRSHSAALTIEHPGRKERVPIRLESSSGKKPISDKVSENRGSSAITHLLVTTKAGSSLAALAQLHNQITPATLIVLLQNGMGHQQQVMAALPDCPIFAGSTTDGAWQEAFLHIHRAGHGVTCFGALNEVAQRTENQNRLRTLLELEALKAEMSDNILAVLHNKLAINSAINGLTILHDCQNGDLLSPALQPHVIRLCRETEAILASEGFYTERPLLEQVNHVLTVTARNISSSLQDIRNGRMTEIAYINGYLLDCAARNNVSAPTHQQLMQALNKYRPSVPISECNPSNAIA